MLLSPREQKRIGLGYILDRLNTLSPFGESQKQTLRPFTRAEEPLLRQELSLLSFLKQREAEPALDTLRRVLMQLKEVRGTIEALEGGELQLHQLFQLKGFLLLLKQASVALSALAPLPEPLVLDPLPAALLLLDPDNTQSPAFAIADHWSIELQQLRKEKRQLEKQLHNATPAQKEALLIARTRLVSLEEQQEQSIRQSITKALGPYKEPLLLQRRRLGHIDLLLSKLSLQQSLGGSLPCFKEGAICAEAMYQPEIDQRLKQTGHSFTPLSLTLPKGLCALTGANMGGKSVALHCLALNVYLAHCGFFVFAEAMELPLLDGLCLIDGEWEDSNKGLSSFGGELIAVDNAAREAKKGLCLCLFDEFARGTNPAEGAKIQQGAAQYFRSLGGFNLFVTHYEGVSALADSAYRTRGLKPLPPQLPAQQKDRLSLLLSYMDYGLVPVDKCAQVPQEALQVIKLLGLEEDLLLQITDRYRP